MKKRGQLYQENPERWSQDSNKCVTYEVMFKGYIMKPGTQFRIKDDRNIYTFLCLVSKLDNGSAWIEATSIEGFKSIRPEKITGIVGLKKSYVKKVNNVK